MTDAESFHYSRNVTNKFIPFYLLAIVMTFTGGILSIATANYLISELHYAPWIGGFIVGLTSLGFMFFAFFWGHVSDKLGQKKVLRYIILFRLIFSGFYLIPIESFFNLILFGGIFFLDGAVGGLFWPTIQQISVLAEKHGGLKLKHKYMSGYNFSWNFGYILGMISGAVVVFLFNSNYFAFFLNLFGVIFGAFIVLGFVKNVSDFLEPTSERVESLDDISKCDSTFDNLLDPQREIALKLQKLPLYSMLAILLIHSMTDGVISIFLPLKMDMIHQGLYWVFLINLVKLISQMFSTTLSSLTKEGLIVKNLLVSIFLILFAWLFLILSDTLSWIILLFIITGIGQGIIYTSTMKIISYKAKKQESARAFSFFQTMMSSGRMAGSLLYGLMATISLNLGIYFLLFYDLVAGIQFILTIKKLYK